MQRTEDKKNSQKLDELAMALVAGLQVTDSVDIAKPCELADDRRLPVFFPR